MSAIDIKDLSFCYGKSPVLTDVNLSIDENEREQMLEEGKRRADEADGGAVETHNWMRTLVWRKGAD